MLPVIIYYCTGIVHLIYCIWSVRSLRAFGCETIEIIVGQKWEKRFIESHLDHVLCEVVEVNRGSYGVWTLRPFALEQYHIKYHDRDVVICDADILWKKDPHLLLNRFKDKAWVHKITSLNPADLDLDIAQIPKSRIGLRTMISYKDRLGLDVYLNFHLNCGLFMLSKDVFPLVLKNWVQKIRLLPPKEMIMTEALLSLVYAEMRVTPICDRENIKHLGIHHDIVDVPVVSFEIAELPEGMFTGYQTAQHYYGDQRYLLHKDAVAMSLDYDNLLAIVKKHIILRNLKKLPKIPSKTIHRFKCISRKNNL